MATIAYCQPDMDYRREVGENQSHLKNILISPAHYKASLKRRFITTVNMEIGSALHCKVLEGDTEFNNRFILKPQDVSFATKEGKEWKQNNKNKTVLAQQDYESVLGMAESLFQLDWFDKKQKDYRKYNELSIYWDSDGIPCKGRLDRLVELENEVIVLDLKTTDSVDPSTFQKKVTGTMNYIFQAAWYSEAASLAFNKPARFIFAAIERGNPYCSSIFEVSDEMMQEGVAQINQARKILKKCLQTKKWPKPEIPYNVLSLPPWYKSPVGNNNFHEQDLF
jgi:hypothetical protein